MLSAASSMLRQALSSRVSSLSKRNIVATTGDGHALVARLAAATAVLGQLDRPHAVGPDGQLLRDLVRAVGGVVVGDDHLDALQGLVEDLAPRLSEGVPRH